MEWISIKEFMAITGTDLSKRTMLNHISSTAFPHPVQRKVVKGYRGYTYEIGIEDPDLINKIIVHRRIQQDIKAWRTERAKATDTERNKKAYRERKLNHIKISFPINTYCNLLAEPINSIDMMIRLQIAGIADDDLIKKALMVKKSFCVTSEEYNKIKRVAKSSGISVKEFVRQLYEQTVFGYHRQ